MTKNEEIANLLGFEKYNIIINKGQSPPIEAWKYPKEFQYLVCCSPMYDIPDFIKMVHDHCKLIKSMSVQYERS